jgi:hypothetical protein
MTVPEWPQANGLNDLFHKAFALAPYPVVQDAGVHAEGIERLP